MAICRHSGFGNVGSAGPILAAFPSMLASHDDTRRFGTRTFSETRLTSARIFRKQFLPIYRKKNSIFSLSLSQEQQPPFCARRARKVCRSSVGNFLIMWHYNFEHEKKRSTFLGEENDCSSICLPPFSASKLEPKRSWVRRKLAKTSEFRLNCCRYFATPRMQKSLATRR